jgi:hypothetical protein
MLTGSSGCGNRNRRPDGTEPDDPVNDTNSPTKELLVLFRVISWIVFPDTFNLALEVLRWWGFGFAA